MNTWGIVALLLVTGIANLLGGGIVVKKNWSKRSLNHLMALSAGFLLAIAMLDLIPESLNGTPGNSLYILLGFFVVFLFQRIVTTHFHFGVETHVEKVSGGASGLGAFIGMMIHSFFDGVSVVAGFEVNLQLGFLVFAAVLIHKIPDGLTISSIVLAAFGNRRRAFIASIMLALSTIAGGLLVWIFSQTGLGGNVNESFARAGLAFSAGIFLYVGATDLLPVVNDSEDRKSGLFVLLGVVMFYVTSLLVGAVGLK